MRTVLIRRNGIAIDVSVDGTYPLPPDLLNVLQEELTYSHVRALRGYEQYTGDGTRRYVETTAKPLYQVDSTGALLTGFGFLTRIVNTLQRHGYAVSYVDMSPARVREQCYTLDWDNLYRNVTFRPGQEECIRLITHNQCGMIDATMGFGKGELFSMLCLLYPHAKFHIVVPFKDVAQSLVQRLSKYFSNVGLIGAGKNYFGSRITVFVVNSVRKSDGDADFLLCDEVHKMAAPVHSYNIGFTWQQSRNFGFSGTVDMRADKADRELEALFGPTLYKMTYQQAEALGLVVPITVRWLQIHMTHNPAEGKQDVRMMRAAIWTNSERNRIIAADVKKHYGDPDTQVLILCQSTQHAVHLLQHLPEFELCYGKISPDDVAKYKREGLLPETWLPMTAARREALREGFSAGTVKKVIATDVWSTGVDFVNLRVLYRVDARSSEIVDNQGPGRVSRIAPDKYGGILVDCWDMFDSRFTNRSMTRRKHYKKLGWKQTNIVSRKGLE